jgi:hypothetical protein
MFEYGSKLKRHPGTGHQSMSSIELEDRLQAVCELCLKHTNSHKRTDIKALAHIAKVPEQSTMSQSVYIWSAQHPPVHHQPF